MLYTHSMLHIYLLCLSLDHTPYCKILNIWSPQLHLAGIGRIEHRKCVEDCLGHWAVEEEVVHQFTSHDLTLIVHDHAMVVSERYATSLRSKHLLCHPSLYREPCTFHRGYRICYFMNQTLCKQVERRSLRDYRIYATHSMDIEHN